jgi:hypothetical protein
MKKLLIVPVLLLIMTQSFGQTKDSLTIVNKNYMNTIQTSVFGFGGYFALQYERALSPNWSVSLIGRLTYPFNRIAKNNQMNYFEKYSVQAELRYYLDKNTINNNGLYVAGDLGYLYQIIYIPEHRNTDYTKKKYPFYGAMFGYQFFVKKRLVIDGALGFEVGFHSRLYSSASSNWGWQKINNLGAIPIRLNIGYAF